MTAASISTRVSRLPNISPLSKSQNLCTLILSFLTKKRKNKQPGVSTSHSNVQKQGVPLYPQLKLHTRPFCNFAYDFNTTYGHGGRKLIVAMQVVGTTPANLSSSSFLPPSFSFGLLLYKPPQLDSKHIITNQQWLLLLLTQNLCLF